MKWVFSLCKSSLKIVIPATRRSYYLLRLIILFLFMWDQLFKELLALSWRTDCPSVFPLCFGWAAHLPSFVERFEELTYPIVAAERKKSRTQMAFFNNLGCNFFYSSFLVQKGCSTTLRMVRGSAFTWLLLDGRAALLSKNQSKKLSD